VRNSPCDPRARAGCPPPRLLAQEGGDAREHVDVLILPDTEVGRRDAALRHDGGRLGDDEARAADGPAAQVDDVPVVGEAVHAGVLAHRADDDPVPQRHAAHGERREEARHGMADSVISLRAK
jgi:hypothetical protein